VDEFDEFDADEADEAGKQAKNESKWTLPGNGECNKCIAKTNVYVLLCKERAELEEELGGGEQLDWDRHVPCNGDPSADTAMVGECVSVAAAFIEGATSSYCASKKFKKFTSFPSAQSPSYPAGCYDSCKVHGDDSSPARVAMTTPASGKVPEETTSAATGGDGAGGIRSTLNPETDPDATVLTTTAAASVTTAMSDAGKSGEGRVLQPGKEYPPGWIVALSAVAGISLVAVAGFGVLQASKRRRLDDNSGGSSGSSDGSSNGESSEEEGRPGWGTNSLAAAGGSTSYANGATDYEANLDHCFEAPIADGIPQSLLFPLGNLANVGQLPLNYPPAELRLNPETSFSEFTPPPTAGPLAHALAAGVAGGGGVHLHPHRASLSFASLRPVDTSADNMYGGGSFASGAGAGSNAGHGGDSDGAGAGAGLPVDVDPAFGLMIDTTLTELDQIATEFDVKVGDDDLAYKQRLQHQSHHPAQHGTMPGGGGGGGGAAAAGLALPSLAYGAQRQAEFALLDSALQSLLGQDDTAQDKGLSAHLNGGAGGGGADGSGAGNAGYLWVGANDVKMEPNMEPNTRAHKVDGKWQTWVLDLISNDRKALAVERRFTRDEVLDLQIVARKHKRATAQRKYHKKKALAAGKSYTKRGRPNLTPAAGNANSPSAQ